MAASRSPARGSRCPGPRPGPVRTTRTLFHASTMRMTSRRGRCRCLRAAPTADAQRVAGQPAGATSITVRKAVVLVLIVTAASCARRAQPAPIPSSPAVNPRVAQGQQVYARYCATCHGVAANGDVADNAPSLRSPTFLASASDVFLRAGIERGRPGTAMGAFGQAFGGPLSPARSGHRHLHPNGASEPRDLPAGASAGGHQARSAGLRRELRALSRHAHPAAERRHLANPVLLATASDGFLRSPSRTGVRRPRWFPGRTC